MSVDWEQTFRNWSKPSSSTESTKAENAIRMVKDAVNSNDSLSKYNINVFVQGSYKNNTNVKQDSDVDICVCCEDLVDSDYGFAPNMNDNLAGLVPATYSYAAFKNDLQIALKDYFGSASVTRGDKAFDVHENSYRVDADVVPTIIQRLYFDDGSYRQGTQIINDSGIVINNWPQQHYDNGVNKNRNTEKRFKSIVRAMKNLRNRLEEKNYHSAKPIPSFLIECLVYLVPNNYFAGDFYKKNVENCIGHLWHAIKKLESCKNWTEINKIKFLFHSAQKWNKEEVRSFLLDAWNYIKSN